MRTGGGLVQSVLVTMQLSFASLPRFAKSCRFYTTGRLALLALLTLSAWVLPSGNRSAIAQLGSTVPPTSHHIAVELLYAGEYRRAERAFRSDLRGGVKTLQSRWVDSICFQTMLGETYYQQGNNAASLDHFDQACQLYLAYYKWLLKVNFPPLRTDTNSVRPVAPWGRTNRQAIYTTFSRSMLVSMGRLDQSDIQERGGTLQPAQFWKVDVVEVMRCAGLAIRRRNELLGPLGPTDRLSKELVETMSRGGGAPAGHWSNAWIELLLGTALMGIDKDKQAVGHIQRAILLEGRLDHPLTGAALLVKGQLAQRAGNAQAAAELFYEASIAALSYGDLDVVTDALWWGHMNHAASGAPGTYPPLQAAVNWADRENLDHVELLLRYALSESLTSSGNLGDAGAVLNGGGRMSRDVTSGRLASRGAAIGANLLLLQGNLQQGGTNLNKAVQANAAVSLANFQTNLANLRLDTGALSPRLAMDVYRGLLEDPTPREWIMDPLDQMTHLSTDQSPALDRWFLAAIARREVPAAIDISEVAKRRRYLMSKPLGGRVLALRTLLGTPDGELDKPQRLQKQALIATLPEYKKLTAESASVLQKLHDGGDLIKEEKLTPEVDDALNLIGKSALNREAMLLQRAYTRLPAAIRFPATAPSGTSAIEETQKLLAEGDAILAFHQAGGALHGFLIAKEDQHHWILPEPRSVTSEISEMLKAFGNHTKSRELPAEQANSEEWMTSAAEVGQLLLKNSRLDLAAIKRLTIVPDGVLWHMPFEALQVNFKAGQVTLIDAATIRYAPTIGLAYGEPLTAPTKSRTLLLADRLSGSTAEEEAAVERQRQLARTADSCTEVNAPVPAASPRLAGVFDRLISTAETELSPADASNFNPAPVDRKRQVGRLTNWVALPNGRPTHWVLGGVRTIAESGLKVGRRGKVNAAVGSELFYMSCDMIASGARTGLVSRWQTGGGKQNELLREYALQIGELPADQAWQRSVMLARGTDLDPSHEPRLKWTERDGAPPQATHPFFWSGFLLLDTVTPEMPESEASEQQEVEKPKPEDAVKRRAIGGE